MSQSRNSHSKQQLSDLGVQGRVTNDIYESGPKRLRSSTDGGQDLD